MWEKRFFKNVHLLTTETDLNVLNNFCRDSAHASITDFRKIMGTDFDGRITSFTPVEGMKWSFVFYIQNLMIMQRLQQVDSELKRLKDV